MKRQSCFATTSRAHADGGGNRRIIHEHQFRAIKDALQLTQRRTEALLADLEKSVRSLDWSIEAELQNCPTRHPSDEAFPARVKSMMARRDNLKVTISSITKRLHG